MMMREFMRQGKPRTGGMLAVAALVLLVAFGLWFALGRGANSGVNAGAGAKTADFGDWRLECSPAQDAGAPGGCDIFQRISVDGGKTPILQVTIMMADAAADGGEKKSGTPRPSLGALTPLAVSLVEGVAAKLDDAPQVKLTYNRCLPQGCYAGLPDSADLVEKLRGGKKFVVGFRLAAADKPTVFELSLKGIGGALDALEKSDAQARGH